MSARNVIALQEFAKWAIREGAFQAADLDGLSIQEKALELGLIEATIYDPERHGPSDCAEPGDEWFTFAPSLTAGYVVLSPDEVRALERDRQAVEFAARWCWRTDPPHASGKLTDAERLSAIKYHPTIKQYGQPHVDLAEKEAVEAEARENYQRHVEAVNRATDTEIAAAIRSLKGGRDAQ